MVVSPVCLQAANDFLAAALSVFQFHSPASILTVNPHLKSPLSMFSSGLYLQCLFSRLLPSFICDSILKPAFNLHENPCIPLCFPCFHFSLPPPTLNFQLRFQSPFVIKKTGLFAIIKWSEPAFFAWLTEI